MPGLANRAYLLAARGIGEVVGRSPVVTSAYVRRSVAVGEVALGRSDVDLTLVIRRPVSDSRDADELLALNRRVRRLRAWTRVLGECEVLDPLDLSRWARTDPYRGSLDRRSVIVVHGAPVEIPLWPIGVDHAARRYAFWLDRYFPGVIRTRNRRNLKKLALEMWNAYATATGRIPAPYLTRRQTEAAYLEAGEPGLPRPLPSSLEGALAFCFELAARLHGRLLSPLAALDRPAVFRASLPPRFEAQTLVVLPGPRGSPPPEAFKPSAFVCTPEALDLFVHYVNPFAYWILPEELLRLGLRRPPVTAFLRACRDHGATFRLRSPGFGTDSAFVPGRRLALMGHALPHLARGEAPPPLDAEELGRMHSGLSIEDYYRKIYPRAYEESERLWEALERVEEPVARGQPGGGA